MAEASKGGCVRRAARSRASTRFAASATATSSASTGATPSSTCAKAVSTGSSAMSVLHAPVAGGAAGFFAQPDLGNDHAAVHSLGHVVDREAGNGHGRQGLHLDARLPRDLDAGRDADPVVAGGLDRDLDAGERP